LRTSVYSIKNIDLGSFILSILSHKRPTNVITSKQESNWHLCKIRNQISDASVTNYIAHDTLNRVVI